MNDHIPRSMASDEIRFKEIIEGLRRHKWAGIIFVLGSTLVALASTYVIPKKYDAVAVIAPVPANTNNQAGALGSLSNNLAALAGVPMTSDPKKIESIAVLQSESLTERYIRENNLLPILYANKWDKVQSRWKNSDPSKVPTLWKATQFFRKHVRTVATDPKTGLITLTVSWYDAQLASTWANGLVQLTNDFEQNSAITESERNIAYLSSEALKTDVIGIKQAIYSILENEFSKAMLAKGNPEYAFRYIDKAIAPEVASFPDRVIFALTAFFASLSIYLFIAFCIVAWSKV